MLDGRVFKVGDGVNTDYIISARYLDVYEPGELAAHLFQGLGEEAARRARQCSILVAGENLGLGSAREQAPNALIGAGYVAVVAKSAARIFFRNSINVGLPVICAPEAADAARDGETLALDLAGGLIRLEDGREFSFRPFPEPVQRILDAGGMFPLLKAVGGRAPQEEGASWA
ncbi:LeuD/DmdB family oxidoreductase small subunit [Desulfocurvus sp. DL9XJH121]